MTGICALTGKDRAEIGAKVDEMLHAMQARGTAKEAVESRIEGTGAVTIGICHHAESPPARPQRSHDPVRVLDGVFFNETPIETPDLSNVDDPSSLFESPGAFAFLGIIDGGLVAARDPLGLKPLYWGKDGNGNFGFASLIASLKRVGIANPKPVGPGQIIEMLDSGPEVSDRCALAKPGQNEIPEDDAVEKLGILLLKAVSAMVPEGSAVSFSGGVDSALVASACKKAGLKPQLVTVGMAGQPELEHAKHAADDIGLPITTKPLTEDEVLEAVSTVVRTVETKSPVTLGISLPFHFACQQAQRLGLRFIVVGQLSDELFGGYARFEEMALKEGMDAVDASMWDSVLAAGEGDFAPGDKVATSFRLELRCPFAYLPIAKFALGLPLNLRVNLSGGKVVRKYVLRRLAEKWGLPAYIASRPKRAFQYSSGVQKVLIKDARRKRRRLGDLISQPEIEDGVN